MTAALDRAMAKMEVRRKAVLELHYQQELLFDFWRQALVGRVAWHTVHAMTGALLTYLADNKACFPNYDKHTESYRFLADLALEHEDRLSTAG